MRRGLPACLATALVSSAGCASAPRAHDALAASFASAEAEHAQALAPDLYAQAEVERGRARQAQDAGARADHETAARLWLEAAQVEAARIELERARRQDEARAEAAAMERAEADRERVAIEAELQRMEAARIARAEAERVFALAAQEEEVPRKQSQARDAARAQAARFLTGRAQLTLDTALALGLSEGDAAPAREAVQRAQASVRATPNAATAELAAQMDAAQHALALAERALGAARARLGAPAAELAASLLEMATERGLTAAVLERGVVIEAQGAFAGGGARLGAAGRALAGHVAALMRAFPHGPVTLEWLPRTGRAERARAEARARAFSAALVAEATATGGGEDVGEPATRVRVAEVSGYGHNGGGPLIVFGAYGPGAPAHAAPAPAQAAPAPAQAAPAP